MAQPRPALPATATVRVAINPTNACLVWNALLLQVVRVVGQFRWLLSLVIPLVPVAWLAKAPAVNACLDFARCRDVTMLEEQPSAEIPPT
jgi:hypothetical protein